MGDALRSGMGHHRLTIRADHVVPGRGFVVRCADFGLAAGEFPGSFVVNPPMKDARGGEWGTFTTARPEYDRGVYLGWVFLDFSGHEVLVLV
jgi:hypothetical protein